jgi:hypothetical protein
MLDLQNKRNYIRRKKYLDESTAQIKTTLEFIAAVLGDTPSPCEIQRAAVVHAQAIEAVCWSPRPRPTAEVYQKLMAAKTAELCRALAKQALPSFDMGQLSKLATVKTAVPPAPPQPLAMPHDLDDGFSPNGDLPNVKLVWEDQNNIFDADFEVELLEISFSRISQQFVYREVSWPADRFE